MMFSVKTHKLCHDWYCEQSSNWREVIKHGPDVASCLLCCVVLLSPLPVTHAAPPHLPRYTLTEGDFHHLKNARLTHLHIPPPALNIVTIHECEGAENSIPMTTRPVAKSSLSIFQVTASCAPAIALATPASLVFSAAN